MILLWNEVSSLHDADSLPRGRVLSIDALRGFDMFWIIGGADFFSKLFEFIDTPFTLSLKDQLEHVYWEGLHFNDVIFPLFLFLVGASLPFALSKRLERGDSRSGIYRHIIKRAIVLYVLGLIYYGLFDLDFANQRYVGVLPRIAICYLFASLIVMNFNIKNQAYWTAGILLAYWAALYLIPVPGYGAGVITPEGNFSVWIDETFLPGRHNHFGACMYGDSTGLLGTIPSTASTLIGTLTGHFLRTSRPQNEKVKWLIIAGIACLITGLAWSPLFPIIKHIWTSSFVLVAGGLCLFIFALFYWIIDVRGYRKWAFPFVVVGLNAITIFVAYQMFDFGSVTAIFVHGFIDHMGAFKPVFMSACILVVEWFFLYFLYKHQIFLKA